jgi:serine/threonine protein kinase
MSKYPDFSPQNYHIERVLGENNAGGRATYLASPLDTHQTVVIKQYQFPTVGSWNGYRAYQLKIKGLRSLNIASIPRYLDSFETPNGFCLVQEYKNAPSLAQIGALSPQEIKDIAQNILEILIYLQQQNPPVIHGDIKPENILIERNNGLKVYLIDFGFARMENPDLEMNHSIRGTVGFMPPEEMFNRQLRTTSDLYSLGVTLICLLTETPSHKINELIDAHSSELHYKHRLGNLHPHFLGWLDKMTASREGDRFPDALTAHQGLKPIPVKAPLFFREKISKYSLKSLVLGISTLGVIALVGITGFIYWKGHTVRLLLHTKDCRGCYLSYLTLLKADLVGANLSEANLRESNLKDSNLSKADLRGVNFSNAYLKGANLTGANLEGAILRGVNLMEANLQGAILEGANLEGAILNGANLTHTNFKFANLLNAKLKNTRLVKSNLEGANLGGANLEGANLKEAVLPNGRISQ